MRLRFWYPLVPVLEQCQPPDNQLMSSDQLSTVCPKTTRDCSLAQLDHYGSLIFIDDTWINSVFFTCQDWGKRIYFFFVLNSLDLIGRLKTKMTQKQRHPVCLEPEIQLLGREIFACLAACIACCSSHPNLQVEWNMAGKQWWCNNHHDHHVPIM